MEVQKDKAKERYEREIRIGMLLLGVLAFAFIGVLARRIWVENGNATVAMKKPVYLSKAERDAIRGRVKPLPLSSVYASTQQKSPEPKKLSDNARREPIATNNFESVPDLEITESDAGESRPANFEDEDREKPAPAIKPPSSLPNSANHSPLDLSKKLQETDETESTEAAKTDPAEEIVRPSKTHRFSEEPNEEPSPASEAESVSPVLNPPDSTSTEDKQKETPKPEAPKAETPPETATPSVRKKVEKNPWKRSTATSPKLLTRRYTVEKGDTLKSIAKDLLSDESRWREIYDLNRSEIGDDFEYLPEGLRLKLPTASDEPPHEAESTSRNAQVPSPK